MDKLIDIFTEQFNAALTELGVTNTDDEQFVIFANQEDEKHTTMDNIYRLWTTPLITGYRMSYQNVITSLVNEKKKVIPLWIKMHRTEEDVILLLISQRFRKMRDVKLRRRDNPICPFVLKDEDEKTEFNSSVERLEAIRHLLFAQKRNPALQAVIGDTIKHYELRQILYAYFVTYTHYPPRYDKVSEGEETYSALVMKRDQISGKFSIFQNNKVGKTLTSNLTLDEAISFYVQSEFKDELFGIILESG